MLVGSAFHVLVIENIRINVFLAISHLSDMGKPGSEAVQKNSLPWKVLLRFTFSYCMSFSLR